MVASELGRPNGPAVWRWGFIIGGSAGALGIAAAVATLALTAGASLLFDGICVLVVLALFFVGGLLVARQTASLGAATLSGVVAGIFSAILRDIATLFVAFSRPLPMLTATGISDSSYHALFVIGAVIGAFIVLLIFGGLGAGLAVLGGLAGRPRYTTPYPVMYPGAPVYMPPGYSAPTYPATMYPAPGYPLPQGYGPPPGYPMPQGFGPPPGYAPPGYPVAGWYPPPSGYPPTQPQPVPGTAGDASNTSLAPLTHEDVNAQPQSSPAVGEQPELPLPPQYPG